MKSIEIDRPRLEKAFTDAEALGPLSSRSKLYERAAAKYNDGNANPITATVARLRFEAWGLTCQTGAVATREANPHAFGRGTGAAPAPRPAGPRKTRGQKFSSHPEFDKNIDTLNAKAPTRYHALVKAVAKGSMKAAIKLQCLQCMGYKASDVDDCRGLSCPLYLFRPYQKGSTESDDSAE